MKKNIVVTLVLIVFFCVAGYIAGNKIPFSRYGVRDIARLEKRIAEKETKIDKYFDYFLSEYEFMGNAQSINLDEDLFEKEGITILAFIDNELQFWSDNIADVKSKYSSNNFSKPFQILGNNSFYVKTFSKDNISLVGLILIKKKYPYENKYLENKFDNTLNLPSKAILLSHPERKYYKVFNSKNEYIFSISFAGLIKHKFTRNLAVALIYSLVISSLFSLLIFILISQKNRRKRNIILFVGLFLFCLLRLISLVYNFPKVFYSFNLFDPVYFACSLFFPSLGDLLIFSIFLTYSSFLIWTFFSFNKKYFEGEKRRLQIVSSFYIVGLVLFFLLVQYIYFNLIFNSSLNLEPFRILELSIYSFIAYLILALNYISLSLLIIKFFLVFSPYLELKDLGINIATLIITFTFCTIIYPKFLTLTSGLFLIFLSVAVGLFCYNKRMAPTFSESVILVLFVSLFTVFYIDVNTKLKEQKAKKVLASNLSTEHDPIAEMLLQNLDSVLTSDMSIHNTLLKREITDQSIENILNYVRKNYFSGFWSKYDLIVSPCDPMDSIFVESGNGHAVYCYGFFDEIVNETGTIIGSSNFYYLDNRNGRVSYFGQIPYVDTIANREVTLFIELYSRRVSEQLGYPELLLDEKVSRKTGYKDYSYAKYFNDTLITHYGDFPYSLGSNTYGKFTNEITYSSFDEYDHLIYNVDRENKIIISKKSTTLFNLLISFSYVTSFFYILIGLIYLLVNIGQIRSRFASNFKNKIQIATISILLFTFILIGSGTIFFSIKQYQDKHYELLSEKIQSVYIELVHMLENEKNLSSSWQDSQYDNLNQLLIKFSDVFYTDINLYSTDGAMIATSRPEIYENKLLAERMDMNAFRELTVNQRAEFVHNETIGNLDFISAYVPFINIDNETLAYLNLPYFTRQEILKGEVSNLIVAVINIYALLILLTVAVTVIISDQLTKPLRLIQYKFGSIKLGTTYEEIDYQSKDEIGSLVKEYNRMVKELAKNVELLAKSEREFAWREMAKQVAHEIKNPLTPMKLSVQHLIRSWKEKNENDTLEEYLNKFSKTMINQIDNLSYIATAFSNFAKMPVAEFKKVKIYDILRNTRELFKQQGDVNIELSTKTDTELWVYIDKEQFSRAILNLVKNSIQSIPSDRFGKIVLEIDKDLNNAVIRIKDNGSGIPNEIQEKMFVPNFTTKTSGMGLGLAITKRIIENAHGAIRYETEVNVGTIFIIELPIVT